jgi:hypothetical protein
MATEKTEKADPRQWFLRIAGGTVFGPVSTRGLIVWAEQGRIVPGNEVSTDRTKWQPAEDVPELSMAWYVEEPGGELVGPFHRTAGEALLREGRAVAGARLVPAREADPARVRRSAEPSAPARRAAEREPHPELTLSAAAGAAPAGDSDRSDEIAELRLRANELETKLQQVMRAAEKDSRAHERQKEALRKTVAQLQRDLEEARAAGTAGAADEGPAASGDASEDIEETRRAFADERRLLEREADDLRARVAALEATAAAAAARPAIPAENEAASQRAAALEAERDRLVRDLTAARETLQTAKREAARAADEAGSRVAKIEKALAERDRSAADVDEMRKSWEARFDAARREYEAERRRWQAERVQAAAERQQVATAEAKAQAASAGMETSRAQLADLEQRRAGEAAQAAERTAAAEAQIADLRTRVAATEQALADERRAHAETLADANARDLDYAARLKDATSRLSTAESDAQRLPAVEQALRAADERIEEQAVRIEKAESVPPPEPGVVREATARLREGEDLLRGVVEEELAAIDEVLEAERKAFLALREGSLRRQERLQARAVALRRISGGDTEAFVERQAQTRASASDLARTRENLETLRDAHQRLQRQAEDRERELGRRIRVLEIDEARLKAQMGEVDALHRRLQDVTETLRQREQELAQEKRLHKTEKDQFQIAEKGLHQRIEELEGSAGAPPPRAVPPPEEPRKTPPGEAPPEPASGRRHFRATPWMRLR